jgi:hypothetical protein
MNLALIGTVMLLPACGISNPFAASTCYPPQLQITPVEVAAGSTVTVQSGPFQCQGSYAPGKTYRLILTAEGQPGLMIDLGTHPVNRDGSFEAIVRIPLTAPAGSANVVVVGSPYDHCADSEGSCAAYAASLRIDPMPGPGPIPTS